MKDYSINREEANTFILSYKIEDNNIIVKRARGGEFVVPYTKENEENILARMEDQVNDSYEFEQKHKNNIKSSLFWAFVEAALFIINIATRNITTAPVLNAVATVLTGSATVLNVLDIVYNKILLNDLKKNKRFLSREEKINEELKTNKSILAGVKEKTVNIIKENGDKPLNINTIDSIPYKDVMKMADNIDAEEEFEFDYTETITLPEITIEIPKPEKPLTRTRTR